MKARTAAYNQGYALYSDPESDNEPESTEEDQVKKKNHLYQCVLAAGYEPEEKGICFGLSLLVIQSILAGNFADFQKKLDFILSSGPATLGMEIKNARKRKKTAEISSLTADELYLLEIDSLLMGIAIHSKPEAFPHLFETGAQTVTQNAKRTFPLTQPKSIGQLFDSGGIVINYGPGLMDLKEYFTTLKQAASDQAIAIVLANRDHTIAIGYHPEKKLWTITDSEKLPTREVENELMMAGELLSAFQAFSEPACFTYISNVYLDSPGPETVALLQAWKRSQHEKLARKFRFYSEQDKIYLLHLAAEGDVETVKFLLAKGVSPDCILSGTTPLFIASSHDQPEIVSALLAVKANPNMGYEDGLSPLIIASENGCIEVVRLLLEHGAEAADACEDGSFPLLVAIECENSSIISLLMSSSCSEDYTQEEADMINDALKKIRNDFLRQEVTKFMQTKQDTLPAPAPCSFASTSVSLPYIPPQLQFMPPPSVSTSMGTLHSPQEKPEKKRKHSPDGNECRHFKKHKPSLESGAADAKTNPEQNHLKKPQD